MKKPRRWLRTCKDCSELPRNIVNLLAALIGRKLVLLHATSALGRKRSWTLGADPYRSVAGYRPDLHRKQRSGFVCQLDCDSSAVPPSAAPQKIGCETLASGRERTPIPSEERTTSDAGALGLVLTNIWDVPGVVDDI